jgi:hypothetical protein
MTGLLGAPYSVNQASYDLTHLCRNGLITRMPHRGMYILTPDGPRFAIFCTKVHDRILRPLMACDQPQAPSRFAPPCASSTPRFPSGSPQHACQPLHDSSNRARPGNSRQSSKSG